MILKMNVGDDNEDNNYFTNEKGWWWSHPIFPQGRHLLWPSMSRSALMFNSPTFPITRLCSRDWHEGPAATSCRRRGCRRLCLRHWQDGGRVITLPSSSVSRGEDELRRAAAHSRTGWIGGERLKIYLTDAFKTFRLRLCTETYFLERRLHRGRAFVRMKGL